MTLRKLSLALTLSVATALPIAATATLQAVARNADGTIYQRPFGGHTANYGEKPVQRACAAADRTGHALLHTLYQ